MKLIKLINAKRFIMLMKIRLNEFNDKLNEVNEVRNESSVKRLCCWSVFLQCVAVCCSVLQCVAVCCSVLQCVEIKIE